MRIEPESKDIEKIADMVTERLLPFIQDQQPKKTLITIDRNTQKKIRNITR